MGVLDEHNRQHTYGNTGGPPTSVVGASAQQAIDAQKRLAEGAGPVASSGADLRGRDALRLAIGCGVLVAIAVVVAYAVGGMGAVVAGLLAVIAGIIGVVFLVVALINGAKAGVSARRERGRRG